MAGHAFTLSTEGLAHACPSKAYKLGVTFFGTVGVVLHTMHTVIVTVQIKIKFPFRIRRTLVVLSVGNYERHFRALSPSPSVINMSNCSSGGSC